MNTIGPLKSLSYVPSAVEPKLKTAPVFLNIDVMSIPSSSSSGGSSSNDVVVGFMLELL